MRGRYSRLLGRHPKKTGLFLVFGIVAAGLLGSGAYAALGGSVRQSTSADIELQRGLVSWYKMDGNLKDAMPNANNATTSTGAFASDRKGKASGAYATDGITQYASIPDADSLDTGSVTVSLWVTVNGTLDCDGNNNWRSLIRKGSTSSSTTGWDIVLEQTGTVNWDIGVSGVTSRRSANVGLTPGTTKLLTVTYNATSGVQTVYANGVQSNTQTITPNPIGANASPLDIGRGANAVACPNGGGYAPVTYDDIRIYNRAITLAETKALYDSYDSGIQAGSGQKGLVGHWKLDGNTKDSSPYAHNAVNTNAATLTSDRKGAANRAYSFNGTSNYMTVADSDTLSPSTITVSAWVYWTGGTLPNIVSKSGNNEYRYRINANGSITVFDRGATNALTSAASAVTQNQWYMVSFSGDASGLKIYVNGQLSTSNSTAYGSPNTTSPLWFGTFDTGSEYMSGSIDDIRIYNRALAAAELLAIYRSYDSQINLNSSPTATTTTGNINQGLVAYWPFSGNAMDATPYSNNGTVTAATLTADRKGTANNAYSFDGATANITVTNNTSLQLIGDMTVSAWVYVTNNGNYSPIVSKNASGEYEIAADFRSGFNEALSWRSNNFSTSTNFANFFTGYSGTWVHVAVTVSGTNATAYRNGNSQGTIAIGSRVATSQNIKIGLRTGTSFYLSGAIDEVRLYDRALSLSEVQALYQSQN